MDFGVNFGNSNPFTTGMPSGWAAGTEKTLGNPNTLGTGIANNGIFGGGNGIGGVVGPKIGMGPGSQGSGSPWSPGGTLPSMYGPDGQLLPQFVVNPSQLDPSQVNTSGMSNSLNFLSNYAGNTGPSPWLTNANAMVDQSKAAALGGNAQSFNTATEGADLSAASHGGLTGGGGARIAAAGMQGEMAANQGAEGQAAMAKNANTVQDWQNKLGVAEALPGQQTNAFNAALQPLEYNTTAQNVAKGVNVGSANTGFGQQMDAYIGNVLGNATANSGKKKG